ncbi:MAG: hypothetical protein ACQKBT_00035 [Puniceicoccales bacterium]
MKITPVLLSVVVPSFLICSAVSAAVPFSDDFNNLDNWSTVYTGSTAPTASGGNLVLDLDTTDTLSLVSNGGAGAYDFIGNPLQITLNDVTTSANTGTSNITTFGFSNQDSSDIMGANAVVVIMNQASRLRVVSYRNGTYNELYDTNDTPGSLASDYDSLSFTVSDTAWSLVTVGTGGSELLNIGGTITEAQFNPGAWDDSYLSIQLSQTDERTALTTVGSVEVTAIPEARSYSLILAFVAVGFVMLRRRR